MIEGVMKTLKDFGNEICDTGLGVELIPKFARLIENRIESFEDADRPLKQNNIERSKSLPKEIGDNGEIRGEWQGERGNSKWIPDHEKVPGFPVGNDKTWGEILKEYDIDGIKFNDGEPDFSPVSKETVKINNFTTDRNKNFKQADVEAAEKGGYTPQEVKSWREENGYTWHERSDCETMDKVPTEVHSNIPHSGGISEAKKVEVDNNER